MGRFLLGLALFVASLLGFSQTNSTQKCLLVKETPTGVVICIVPCEENKGGKNHGMASQDSAG